MKLLFAGNPNTGKTALINAISGSNLEVGNWPGVTVEKKEAHFTWQGKAIHLVDLPGAYTLTPYSLEEKIVQKTLFEDRYDGIVDVVDATNLKRNLYLTLELIELQKPMVVALNFFDIFTKAGYAIDLKRFSNILGVDVIPTVASKALGTKELLRKSLEAVEERKRPKIIRYNHHLENEIHFLIARLKKIPELHGIPYRAVALKLLERCSYIQDFLRRRSGHDFTRFADEEIARLERHIGKDIKSIIIEERYRIIEHILSKTLKEPLVNRYRLTQRIDAVVLHRLWALPIFFAVMYALFKLTFSLSEPAIEWIDALISTLSFLIESHLSGTIPDLFVRLIVDGALGGVGLVISFLPLLALFYFLMALLEESGYMARVSFIFDHLAQKLGIEGKAFIPLIVAFGCNVPAVYSTRAMDSPRARLITALVTPFMSCSARLMVYIFFVSIFFTDYQAEIVMGLYILGILIALGSSLLLHRLLPFAKEKPYIQELPHYHIPTFSAILRLTLPKLRDFLVRAGTVILLAALVLSLLSNAPDPKNIENSYLARGAKAVAPLFEPLGFGQNWKAVAALLPGTLAKEVVVGSFGTLYSAEGGDVKARIAKDFTPLSALSYLIFVLLYIPCIATMAALRSEFGWRVAILETLALPLVAYGASLLFYQSAKFLIG